MTNKLKIGWIGCGVMGQSMARHCMTIGGHQLFVSSRTVSRCQPLQDLGATLCYTPAEIVAHRVDIIVAMAGFPKDTEDIVFGIDGVLEGIKRLKEEKAPIFIDMSTGKPCLATRIAKAFQDVGSDALDAPVSGGDIGARERRLTVMVGGNKLLFDSIHNSFFSCVTDITKGGGIHWMGLPGNGQKTKMVNQILIATNMIGVCEALLFAHKSGLNPLDVLPAVSMGAAGSWNLSNLAPRILARDFSAGFFVEHFVKDMEIALDEAKRLNLALPGLALAHQLYVAVKAQGHAKSGTQALILALETLNDVKHSN